MLVAPLAANEHQLAHCPCNRGDRVLFDAACVVQQRNVRDEICIRPPPQSTLSQDCTKHLAERFKPARPIIAYQHERTIARLSLKADGSVEDDIKWRYAQIFNRRAHGSDHAAWQSAEKE